MNARAVHFWGMTDHAPEDHNPITGKGTLPYHLQSYWLAVPPGDVHVRSLGALLARDARFGLVHRRGGAARDRLHRGVRDAGYVADVAFTSDDYGCVNASLFAPRALIDDGCPVLKRRPFFHWPPFLDRTRSSGGGPWMPPPRAAIRSRWRCPISRATCRPRC